MSDKPSSSKTPTRPSSASTTITTAVFLLIFIVAFFPHQFIHLLSLPVQLLSPRPLPKTPSTSALVCSQPHFENKMSWMQRTFTLPPKSRGSYLVTSHVEDAVPEIRQYRVGLVNLFLQHTSAALSLNENWDEDVRADMSDAMDRLAPEDKKGNLYRHSAEGPDDMPAHIKSALIGASVTIPIKDGKLATGTWQGIWYLEFRASKHTRKVVATIQGEKM